MLITLGTYASNVAIDVEVQETDRNRAVLDFRERGAGATLAVIGLSALQLEHLAERCLAVVGELRHDPGPLPQHDDDAQGDDDGPAQLEVPGAAHTASQATQDALAREERRRLPDAEY